MGDQAFPIKAVPFEPDRDQAIKKAYPNIRDGFLRGEPGGHVAPQEIWSLAPKTYNFKVKPDDVWLLGFPKSGTNWVQEIVWLLNHNCDFELAKSLPLLQRVPNLELRSAPVGNDLNNEELQKRMPRAILSLEEQEAMESPRHFKTHFPFHLLPPNLLDTAKVVYLARNPKDVIVSYYNHHKLIKMLEFNGSLEEFAEFFMGDEVSRAPYFGNVLEAWNIRKHPNMHFAFYEDFKSNLRGEIAKLAKFLNRSLSEDQMEQLLQHSTFENCKKHINHLEVMKDSGFLNTGVEFFRKGKTGDWKTHFSPELNARLDEWIQKNLSNTDLSFKMELACQD